MRGWGKKGCVFVEMDCDGCCVASGIKCVGWLEGAE